MTTKKEEGLTIISETKGNLFVELEIGSGENFLLLTITQEEVNEQFFLSAKQINSFIKLLQKSKKVMAVKE